MVIGGLQKFSLLDYPEQLAAIVFTQGCNYRCQYCYNPMLVRPEVRDKFKNRASASNEAGEQNGRPQFSPHVKAIFEDDFFVFLKSRQNKLDAVVITGGEPTLQEDLPQFIKKIKQLGYRVKLDTNGSNPKKIAKLIEEKLIDYIAMDLKGSPQKYSRVIGVKPNLANIKKSIKIIMNSKLPYEFRTTVVPGLIEIADIKAVGGLIKGAEKWFLQQFQNASELVNQKWRKIKPYKPGEIEEMRRIGQAYVKNCQTR